MKLAEEFSLLHHNTFHIDAKVDYFVEYESVGELQSVLQMNLIRDNRVFHIGSGSNLLFLTDFKGVILHSLIHDIDIVSENEDGVIVRVGSGVVWDDLVAFAVEKGWGGIENLSLIPGEVGASAVQNIGAYGVEVKDVIEQVETVEITTGKPRTFSNRECKYAYRESIFKKELKGKYIVTSVIFRLNKKPVFQLGYQHLEEAVLQNGEISLANIRKTVIEIRESKLPDPDITGNAGSFFKNPVVSKELFLDLLNSSPEMPHYYVSETLEKLPAAWLIDQCGWKGKQMGNAGVHENQALVLVNKGGATGQEIVELAKKIQESVQSKFGVELIPEVNFI